MNENMWIVDKSEYDTCTVNASVSSLLLASRNIFNCRNPSQLRYFEMVFRSHSPTPGGLEFSPGKKYYFIGMGMQVVVNFFSQLFFIFTFLLGMVMYANEDKKQRKNNNYLK